MSRTERMNDFDERAVSAAEADFERLLSVEPSPEFAAKVRARVAEERMNRSRGWGWVGLLTTVAAAVILVLVLRSGLHPDDDRRPFSTPEHADTVLNAPNANPPNPVSVAPGPRNDRPQVRHSTVAEQKAEIIIDPAIGDAIRRLAVATRNTTLDASKGESIAAPNSESDVLPIAEQLHVPEIVLGPADPDGGQ